MFLLIIRSVNFAKNKKERALVRALPFRRLVPIASYHIQVFLIGHSDAITGNDVPIGCHFIDSSLVFHN